MTSTRFLPTKRSQNTTAKSASLPTLSTWLAVNKPQIPEILKKKTPHNFGWTCLPSQLHVLLKKQQEFQTISVKSVPKSNVHTCRWLVPWKPVDLLWISPKNIMASRIGSDLETSNRATAWNGHNHHLWGMKTAWMTALVEIGKPWLIP